MEEIHLHKSNGVYHVRASALSEHQDSRNDAGPPYKPTNEERLTHLVNHCVKGLTLLTAVTTDYHQSLNRLRSIGAMVLLDKSACEKAVATIIYHLALVKSHNQM